MSDDLIDIETPPVMLTSDPDDNSKDMEMTEDVIEDEAQPDLPTYTMSTSLTSIEQVLSEYLDGLNGRYPVKFLDSNYGTSWRQNSNTEAKKYSECKVSI